MMLLVTFKLAPGSDSTALFTIIDPVRIRVIQVTRVLSIYVLTGPYPDTFPFDHGTHGKNRKITSTLSTLH